MSGYDEAKELRKAIKLLKREVLAWRDWSDRKKAGHNDGVDKVEKAMEAVDDAGLLDD